MRRRAGLRVLFMCLDFSFLFFCQLVRIERLEWRRLILPSLRVTALTLSTCLTLLTIRDLRRMELEGGTTACPGDWL